jgi:drug/metabolite transporter (DMT)-like permease
VSTAIAVVAALASAACFGVASVLQQRAARTAPAADALRLRLLRRLVRRRVWVAGVALAAFSYGVQAVALAFGPLVLVQPLAATDLLFALPLMAGRHPTAAQWCGAALVTAGVATFLALSPPRPGVAAPALADWFPAFLGVVVVVVTAVAVARRRAPMARTMALATAGSSVFALLDALSKSFVDLLRTVGVAAFGHWEPYALLGVGLVGMVLSQTAFQSGPLTISLPVIDTVEPTGAVLIGVTVFDERIATAPPVLAGQIVAAVVAVTGIVLLGRSAARQQQT